MFKNKAIANEVKDYLFITLGLLMYTFGWTVFLLPYQIVTGGVTGIAAIVYYASRIPISYTYFIINLALLVVALKILGFKFMVKTVYAILALSVFLWVAQNLMTGTDGHMLRLLGENNVFMSMVVGCCFTGSALAVVFLHNGSTGGTDIVALILAKYTSMEIGKALMASDILIVLAAAWRFGMGTGLYCILGLIGKSFVVDGAIENIRLRKVCTIMTANPQPILDFIIKEMNRSATVEKAYGAYTHHELSVLVTVLTRRQALQLRNFLRENDPHSFITIVNSSEIIGKGFRSFN